jgi:hypothetical protein
MRSAEEINLSTRKGVKIQRQQWHNLLGHCHKEIEELTARKLGIQLTGKMNKCESCIIEKIRKKNISKESSDIMTKPGECFYLDIQPMKARSLGGSKYWVLIVD